MRKLGRRVNYEATQRTSVPDPMIFELFEFQTVLDTALLLEH